MGRLLRARTRRSKLLKLGARCQRSFCHCCIVLGGYVGHAALTFQLWYAEHLRTTDFEEPEMV